MLAVLFYLGCIGFIVSLSLVVPSFVALLENDQVVAQRFAFHAVIGAFVFALPVLATRGRQGRLTTVGGLVLLMTVWFGLAFPFALPLYDIAGISYLDALFDTVSALTTTGASTLSNVDSLPQSVVFWRIQLQWFGGLLALLTILAILAPMGIGGLTPNAISMEGRVRDVVGPERLVSMLRTVGLGYAIFTVVVAAILFALGLRAFNAATLAMTATSTGGFLPFEESPDRMLGTAGMVIVGIVFLIGATSVFWHRMVLGLNMERLRAHRESYSVILLSLVVMFAFAIALNRASGAGLSIASLAESFFNAASLIATSGIESRPGFFTLFPLGIVLFIVLLGGSAFSTSGGLKHYRMGAMATQSWRELDRLVYPSSVTSRRFGSQRYDLNLMKAIWSFFVVAILVISVSTVMVASSGVTFEASLTAVIACFSTAGPVYESGWNTGLAQSWPTYGELPAMAKGVLMLTMLLGRLEVLAVFGLLNPLYWRNR